MPSARTHMDTPLSRREFVHAGATGLGAFAMMTLPLEADESPQPAGDFIDAHAHVWPSDTAQYP